MAKEQYYLGQCIDWSFPFELPEGELDLNLYDDVEIRFQRGTGFIRTVAPTILDPTTAFYHSATDFFPKVGEDYRVQAWARVGVHWTPSAEIVLFDIVKGVPQEVP
jgi:hypothetical protein